MIKKEAVKGRPGSGDTTGDNYKAQAQPFDGIAILPSLRRLHVRNRHQNAPFWTGWRSYLYGPWNIGHALRKT